MWPTSDPRGAAAARALRKRCEARARDLPIPVPFDEVAFCAMLAEQRGRPIRLAAMPLQGVLTGLVIHGEAEDWIVYERHTTPLHQRLIVVHEGCHLILGHQASPLLQSIPAPAQLSVLGLAADAPALARVAYASEDEREAEVLARLILQRSGLAAWASAYAQEPETRGRLIAQGLGRH